ncbi:MAG: hypothetical protein ACXWLH_02325 [Candidatus Saccharimonadales bacterium]
MNNLYFLGGPPRVGKSVIMESVVREHPMQLIATDAIQHGFRNILINNPHQILKQVNISGTAELKKPNEPGAKQEFSKTAHEQDFARAMILGMLDHYARNRMDVAVEGVIVTPEWVRSLNLADFSIRAAFVGYKDPNHVDAVIDFAKQNEADWINKWLSNEDGDKTSLRAWFAEQAKSNYEIAKSAEQYGFPYFDITEQPFDAYLATVKNYLLTGSTPAS